MEALRLSATPPVLPKLDVPRFGNEGSRPLGAPAFPMTLVPPQSFSVASPEPTRPRLSPDGQAMFGQCQQQQQIPAPQNYSSPLGNAIHAGSHNQESLLPNQSDPGAWKISPKISDPETVKFDG